MYSWWAKQGRKRIGTLNDFSDLQYDLGGSSDNSPVSNPLSYSLSLNLIGVEHLDIQNAACLISKLAYRSYLKIV